MTNNLHPSTVTTQLLPDMFNELCSKILNEDFTDTLDTSKRLMIENAKLIHGLKGTSASFEYFVRYMAPSKLYDDGVLLNFSDLEFEISENEAFWNRTTVFVTTAVTPTLDLNTTIVGPTGTASITDSHAHEAGQLGYISVSISGTFTGTNIPVTVIFGDNSTTSATITSIKTEIFAPSTYVYSINQNADTVFPLLKNIHPAGYHFIVSQRGSALQSVTDTFSATVSEYYQQNYAHLNIGLDNLRKPFTNRRIMPRWWGISEIEIPESWFLDQNGEVIYDQNNTPLEAFNTNEVVW